MQMKGDRSADQKAWELLRDGNMSGIDFAGKATAAAMFKRIKPNDLTDAALALALGQCVEDGLDEEVEAVLSVQESAEKAGPFDELKETFGYPVFQDQIDMLMMKYMKLGDADAQLLRRELSRKKFSSIEAFVADFPLGAEHAELLVDWAAHARNRQMLIHMASLIFEACWLKANCAEGFFEKNPITIGNGDY